LWIEQSLDPGDCRGRVLIVLSTHHVIYTYTTQQTVATSYLSSYTVAPGVLADGQKNAVFFGEHQRETIARPECPEWGARVTDIRLCRESGAEEHKSCVNVF